MPHQDESRQERLRDGLYVALFAAFALLTRMHRCSFRLLSVFYDMKVAIYCRRKMSLLVSALE